MDGGSVLYVSYTSSGNLTLPTVQSYFMFAFYISETSGGCSDNAKINDTAVYLLIHREKPGFDTSSGQSIDIPLYKFVLNSKQTNLPK